MGIELSESDLMEVESTLSRLLSPLAHETPQDWMRAVMADLRQLLHASHAHFYTPLHGWISDMPAKAQEEFRAYYHRYDVAPIIAARKRIPVSCYEQLVGRDLFRAGEFFNDWIRPHRLFDNHGMGFPLPHLAAAARPPPLHAAAYEVAQPEPAGRDASVYAYLAFTHDSPARESETNRGVQLLRLLYPAFRAGVRGCVDHALRLDGFGRLLDQMAERALIWNMDGRLLHVNSACARLLEGDPQAQIIVAAAATQARRLARIVRHPGSGNGHPTEAGEQEFRTESGSYRLRATVLGEPVLGMPALLVVVDPQFCYLMSESELRARYRLTRREAQVAMLIADGLDNRRIAATLCISPHTARRHTEHVLQKLAIRSRAQVADRLRCR